MMATGGVQAASMGRHKLGDNLVENTDPRGEPYYWVGSMREEDATVKGADIHTSRAGWITATPIHIDLTHWQMLEQMRSALGPGKSRRRK